MTRFVLALVFALLGSACQQPIEDSSPRMGALVGRTGERGVGYATATLLSSVVATASADSGELDCRGYARGGWFAITFAGMAAGTDLVGSIELRGGMTAAIAAHLPMPISATGIIPLGASLPTGLTVDSGADGFDIADTFQADTTVLVPMLNLPPYMSARFTRTSGGTAATVSVAAFIQ